MTIRRQPSDFIVEERIEPSIAQAWAPEPPPGAGAAFAVYRLGKRSLTTPEATSRLAGALGVKPGAVAHAGLKDKHAQTTQHVTVADAEGLTLPERGENEAWWFERVGWSSEPASAGWISGNWFEIVVRDLTREASDEMERAARALSTRDSDALAVVNYFGDQRFGSARHGEGFAARRLVDGDFDGAMRLLLASPHRKDTGAWRDFTRLAASKWGKWKLLAKELPARQERGAFEILARGGDAIEAFESLPYFLREMCVDAYQSHLWNATVRQLVRDRCGKMAMAEREDDFGTMVFPMSSAARAALIEGTNGGAGGGVGAWSGEVPMPGPGTALEPPWGSAMSKVLREEGLTIDRLRIPDLRRPAFAESWRDVIVEARGFEMSRAEADDMTTRSAGAPRRGMRAVRFELPRGAYATVVLRAMGQ